MKRNASGNDGHVLAHPEHPPTVFVSLAELLNFVSKDLGIDNDSIGRLTNLLLVTSTSDDFSKGDVRSNFFCFP